jgi:hypothetical protein
MRSQPWRRMFANRFGNAADRNVADAGLQDQYRGKEADIPNRGGAGTPGSFLNGSCGSLPRPRFRYSFKGVPGRRPR